MVILSGGENLKEAEENREIEGEGGQRKSAVHKLWEPPFPGGKDKQEMNRRDQQ